MLFVIRLNEFFFFSFYSNPTLYYIIILSLQLFGGRDWSAAGNAANKPSPETSIAKRAASIRFRRKKKKPEEASATVRSRKRHLHKAKYFETKDGL